MRNVSKQSITFFRFCSKINTTYQGLLQATTILILWKKQSPQAPCVVLDLKSVIWSLLTLCSKIEFTVCYTRQITALFLFLPSLFSLISLISWPIGRPPAEWPGIPFGHNVTTFEILQKKRQLQGSPTYAVFTTADHTTVVFGLRTRKWGIFACLWLISGPWATSSRGPLLVRADFLTGSTFGCGGGDTSSQGPFPDGVHF